MEETQKQTTNKIPFLLGGIVLIIIIIGIGVMMMGQKNSGQQPVVMEDKATNVPSAQPTSAAATASDSAMSQDAMTVEVEGGSFYFTPNEIRVKKGQKVKIVFTSKQGIHDFVIDEFNVKTESISGGKTAEVEFTPDKTGTFEFYCSVGNHRAMDMKGNLIVE